MTTTPDDAADNDSPFAGGGFDLYGAGKRRRGGPRRVAAATPAVADEQTPVARANEPRSFSRSFGFSGRARPTAPVADGAQKSEPLAGASTPTGDPSLAAEDEGPMMLATPYYARKPANTTRNLNRIIFPAIVVLAVAAAGAWFLMTPSQTSPNDQATVSTTTTATNTQVAPSAPYMTPGGASPIADPIAAVNPPALTPAPARIAAPPRAAPARTARAQPERVASGRRTTVARTSRSAPNAEDSSADVAARVPTDVSPAPPPLAAPAPPPMISAPAMTPPADPTGAVNPPIQ